MDALARLGGSVAHDFNNVLTAIQGYTELILLRYGEEAPLRADLEEVQVAAKRGSELTRRLLAFGHGTPSNPEALDLSELARDMEGRLRSLIGPERSLELDLAPGGAPIEADRAQVEDLIVRLVERARDATPSGGTVTLRSGTAKIAAPPSTEASPLPPGRYSTITVEDTGEDVGPDSRARVFEPTFSINETEMSEALRLAIALRAVHQSRGFVSLASAPGQGAAITVFLPTRSNPPAADRPPRSAEP